jgi:hypothetical protein
MLTPIHAEERCGASIFSFVPRKTSISALTDIPNEVSDLWITWVDSTYPQRPSVDSVDMPP